MGNIVEAGGFGDTRVPTEEDVDDGLYAASPNVINAGYAHSGMRKNQSGKSSQYHQLGVAANSNIP